MKNQISSLEFSHIPVMLNEVLKISSPSAEKKFISANLFGKKPSFSAEENPKSINRISADSVAFETLNILGIENDLDRFEVFSMGNLYHSRLIEVVPDFTPDLADKHPLPLYGPPGVNAEIGKPMFSPGELARNP